MALRQVVIDSCCTLNLLATGREVAIVRALDLKLLDTPQVSGESMYLWTPPDNEGTRAKESTSTAALREGGHLATHPLDTDELVDAFVTAASRIKDTDASCIAVAGVLRLPLVSDDRKERRIALDMFPGIELISTLDLLRDASRALAWSDRDLAEVAVSLRWRGNFAPPKQDPLGSWYASLCEPAE
jgi:predicted nucleic acid-binding protein